MTEHIEPTNEFSAEDLSEQMAIRRGKLAELQTQGRDPFLEIRFDMSHHSADIHEGFDALEGQSVRVAGRLMTKRLMGKASFCDVLDREGRIQIYVKRDEIGEEAYAGFKHFDIGDIVGISGVVFKTQKGEISVRAEKITLLAKSLNVLPEKWHGLRDTEARYRQRYLDLIVNAESRKTFITRSKIIKAIRNYLDGKGFIEVDTPILKTASGGETARPFITHHNTLDMDMFLRISLELPLKRLIVGGLERVYEMAKVFRNEGIDTTHNPEFTMLELYQAYTDYHGMMDLTEDMFRTVALETTRKLSFDFLGHVIDLSKPFEKISMLEAVKKYAGVDFSGVETVEQARGIADGLGLEYGANDKKGDILNLIFEEYAEKHLIQPTFLMDHPIEISPLTKRKPGSPGYVERFEVFIAGKEFGNAYTELNDPIDQRERFEYQEALRRAANETSVIDEDFLSAIEYGMPPTGGLGVGVERFIMLLTESASIRDVILFPTMKPILEQ